ncbi:MAG: hypothetical protein CMN30_30905 [Sandaracinus sp.]|nr:hypothetical protein [Sandaracinus sp.]
MRSVFTCALVAALAVAPVGAEPVDAQDSLRRALSRSELARLGRGRLVVRSTTERRGSLRLIGGTSYQVVDLTPDQVWRALNDRGRYLRHMLPSTESAREIRRRGNVRTMRLVHAYGLVSASYAVNFTYDAAHKTVVFRLADDEPRDLRAGWGFIRVRPWGDDGTQTLLSFGMMADVGTGLVSGALRPTLHEWMMKVPWTIKKYLEGSGRSRYDR